MNVEQKQALIPLIPKMIEGEKAELFVLIEESHEVEEEAKIAEENYQKDLFELNKEYEEKMNTVVREETSNARKEFESMEHQGEVKELENLEDELNKL